MKRKRRFSKQNVLRFEEYLRISLTEGHRLLNIEPNSEEGENFLFQLAVGYTVQFNIYRGKTDSLESENVLETAERIKAGAKLATSTGEWVALICTPDFDLTERIDVYFKQLIASGVFILPHIDKPTKQPWRTVRLGQPRRVPLN